MHRRALLGTIEHYARRFPSEVEVVDRFTRFVRSDPDCFEQPTASPGMIKPAGSPISPPPSTATSTPAVCPVSPAGNYGFDGNPPAGKLDLVPTLLHEMAHGLAFLTFVDLASGAKLGASAGKGQAPGRVSKVGTPSGMWWKLCLSIV
jgi:hypothetical protein